MSVRTVASSLTWGCLLQAVYRSGSIYCNATDAAPTCPWNSTCSGGDTFAFEVDVDGVSRITEGDFRGGPAARCRPPDPACGEDGSVGDIECDLQVDLSSDGTTALSVVWESTARAGDNGSVTVDLFARPWCRPGSLLNQSDYNTTLCQACPGGYYCPDAGTSEVSGNVTACGSPEVYCPDGSAEPQAVEPGYFAVDGRFGNTSTAHFRAQQVCPPGSYCVRGVRYACSAGRYGATAGLDNETCSGDCPAGTSSAEGAEACVDCIAGRYARNRSSSACDTCPPGYYCPPSTGDPLLCGADEGTVGPVYCPAGASAPQPIPLGSYGTGDVSGGEGLGYNATKRCDLGYYCPPGSGRRLPCEPGTYGSVEGLLSAVCMGACSPGYWCEAASSSPTQHACGGFNWYCPAGSPLPVQVPPGHYSIGGVDSLEGTDMSAVVGCEPGYYCIDGRRSACQPGRWGNVSLETDSACSGICEGGHFCPAASTRSREWRCGNPTFYCPEGSGSRLAVSFGHYSLPEDSDRATDQLVCPKGFYCASGIKHVCPAGVYGDVEGLGTERCGGLCIPGYFCGAGTTSAVANPCGTESEPRKYCPLGSDRPSFAQPGYYVQPEREVEPARANLGERVTACPTGQYCPDGRRHNCPHFNGFVGPAAFAPYGTDECGGRCPAGTFAERRDACVWCGDAKYYCPGGVRVPTPSGYYSVSWGSSVPVNATLVPASRPNSIYYDRNRCAPGRFCVDGTSRACACGRYGSSAGLSSEGCSGFGGYGEYSHAGSTAMSDCGSIKVYCPPNTYWDQDQRRNVERTPSGCKVVTAPRGRYTACGDPDDLTSCIPQRRWSAHSCKRGHVCTEGEIFPCEPGTRNPYVGKERTPGPDPGVWLVNPCVTCRAGRYCPEASIVELFCGGAQYYCPTGAPRPRVVSIGFYSTHGTELTRSQQTVCPVGSYCRFGVRIPCIGGTWNGELAQTACTALCFPGYRCPGGDDRGDPFSCTDDTVSPESVYCPEGSVAPRLLLRGWYSTPVLPVGLGLAEEVELQHRQRRSGAQPCPPGSWCHGGHTLACSAGRFGAVRALHTPVCSGKCPVGFVCGAGASSPLRRPCGGAEVYCPGGGGTVVPVQEGFYSLNKETVRDEWVDHLLDEFDNARTLSARWFAAVGGSYSAACTYRDDAFTFNGGSGSLLELTSQPFTLSPHTHETVLEFDLLFGGDNGMHECGAPPLTELHVLLAVGTPSDVVTEWVALRADLDAFVPSMWHTVRIPVAPTNNTGPEIPAGNTLEQSVDMFVRFTVPGAAAMTRGDTVLIDRLRLASREIEYTMFVGDDDEPITTAMAWDSEPEVVFRDDFEDANLTVSLWSHLSEDLVDTVEFSSGPALAFTASSAEAVSTVVYASPDSSLDFDLNFGGPLQLVTDAREAALYVDWRYAGNHSSGSIATAPVVNATQTDVDEACVAGLAPLDVRSSAELRDALGWMDEAVEHGLPEDTVFFANLFLVGEQLMYRTASGWMPTFLPGADILTNATLSSCVFRSALEAIPVPLLVGHGITPRLPLPGTEAFKDVCTRETSGVVLCAPPLTSAHRQNGGMWTPVLHGGHSVGTNDLLRRASGQWRHLSVPLPRVTESIQLRLHASVAAPGVVLVDNAEVSRPVSASDTVVESPLKLRAAELPCGNAGWWCSVGLRNNATEGYYTVGGQGPETRTAEVLCPAGHYCTRGIKRACDSGFVCAPGSASPSSGPCAPPPVWCAAASSEPITVRPGYYSVRRGGSNVGEAPCGSVTSYCKDGLRRETPDGWYAFGESNMTLSDIEPCGSFAVYCVGGARFVAPPGKYTTGPTSDGRFQFADVDCGDVQHWCSGGVRHLVDVGSYTVPRDGHAVNRTGAVVCEPGYVCKAGVRYPCPYGTFNEASGAHDDAACILCPAGTYNDRLGVALQSDACLPCPPLENSTEGARVCWPGIHSVTAVDSAPQQPGLGVGDSLIVQFTKPTNAPNVRFDALFDLFNFSASVGTLDGQWDDEASRLTIRIGDSTDADDPAITRVGLLNIDLLSAGGLRDAAEQSQPARTFAPVTVVGSWGPWPAPQVEHMEAFDTDPQQAGVGNGDTLLIRFDMQVMTPPLLTRDEVDEVFEFGSSIGTAYSGSWHDDRRSLLLRIDNAEGVVQRRVAVGDLLVMVRETAQLRSRDQDSPASTAVALLEAGTWGDVPEAVLLGVDSKTSIEVVWRPPVTNFNYLVSRYLLEWALNAEFQPLVNSTVLEVPAGRESYRFVVQDVMNGTDYFFRMRAENIDRFGPIKLSYPDAIQTGLPSVQAITGGAEMATVGGEEVILVGKNFGREGSTAITAQYSNGNYTIEAASCVVWAAGTQVRCVSSPGVGTNFRWRVRVGKFWSPYSPPTTTTSYAAPTVAAFRGEGASGGTTAGQQLVVVRGTQFGERQHAAVDSVHYETETEDGRRVRFPAYNCSIAEDHVELHCLTTPGAGTGLEWTIFVAGQRSVAPATRYAPPVVHTVEAPAQNPTVNPHRLDTRGGELVNVSGADFGPVDPSIPLTVTYGPSGVEYVAEDCRVVEAHASILCYTVEGVGAQHRWIVTRLAQSSAPSEATTSYAPPRMETLTPPSGPTSGGWTITIVGTNFGDGSDLRVMLNGAHFTNFVRDSHTQLTLNIAAGEGVDHSVRLSVGFQSSNTAYFSYDLPRIDSVDILEVDADGSAKVLLLGDSFGYGDSVAVEIGGEPCVDAVVVKHVEAQCVTSVVRGLLVLFVGDRASPAVLYDYFELLTPPVIASISPEASTTTGEPELVISGTYFKNSGGNVVVTPIRVDSPLPAADTNVTTEAEEATIAPWNATLLAEVMQPRTCTLLLHTEDELRCSFPPGQGSVMIKVVVRRLESTLFRYEFADPVIAELAPLALPTSGGIINITGQDFGVSGTVVLDFGDVLRPCEVLLWNHSSILCRVPAGEQDEFRLFVEVSGKSTDDIVLSYMPPVIFNVTPGIVGTAGGTVITLHGENFGLPAGGQVLIGEDLCVPVDWNHTSVRCRAPEGEGLRVPIVLFTGEQASGGAAVGTDADVYLDYFGPQLHEAQPLSEPLTIGGWPLQLQGSDFGRTADVFVADSASRSLNGLAVAGMGARCPVVQRSHTQLTCTAPAGLGSDVIVHVVVADQTSNVATFSYAPPVVDSVTPNVFDAHASMQLTVAGRNFGTQLPQHFAVTVDGRPCTDGSAGWRGRDSEVLCTTPGLHAVGAINLTVAVQNLTSELAWVRAECVEGFFGRDGELCRVCAEGAVCQGAGQLPYPQAGYWRQEPYPFEFLLCQPENACPGGPTSPCSVGYTGEVCRECADRFYRVQTWCEPCPDQAWLLILGFICAVLAMGGLAYYLNKKRVNLSGLTVGVDFAQSASVFARFEFAWPALLRDVFSFISLFTLNIDVVAPSCSIKWTYSLRFFSIQAGPLFVASCLLTTFIVVNLIKGVIACMKWLCASKAARLAAHGFLTAEQVKQRVEARKRKRAERIAAEHLGRKNKSEKLDLKLQDVLVGMFLSALYYMYLVVASSALEIFDCTENANGLVTLDAEPSLTCWEGVHAELWPYALASLIGYGVGIPSLFAAVVRYYREDIKYDQALRSRGEGDSMANPVIRTRIRFAKLYMDFKPEVYYWRLWLIIRKAMLATVALMFNQNAMFQASVSIGVMFTAYVLHARSKPFLPRQSISQTLLELSEHERKASIGGKGKAKNRRQSLVAIAEQVKKQRAMTYVVDYNTLESAFLICSMLLLLSGMIFSSAHWSEDSLEYDLLTYTVLTAIVLSSISFFVILVVETFRALRFAAIQARARRLEVELAERLLEQAATSSGTKAKRLLGRAVSFRRSASRGKIARASRGRVTLAGGAAQPKSATPEANKKPTHLRLKLLQDDSAKPAEVSPRTMNKLVTQFATGERPLSPPPASGGAQVPWTTNPLSPVPASKRFHTMARRLSTLKALKPGVAIEGRVVPPPPTSPPPAAATGAAGAPQKGPGQEATAAPKTEQDGDASRARRRARVGFSKKGARKVKQSKAQRSAVPGTVLDRKRRRASMLASAKLAAPPGVRRVRRPHRVHHRATEMRKLAPRGDPTDWRKVRDDDSGMWFWYSELLGESVWIADDDDNPQPPTSEVDDWERHDDDGLPFWYSPSRGYSIWFDPHTEEDWEAHVDPENGIPFWFSPSRGYSVWTDPTVGTQRDGASGAAQATENESSELLRAGRGEKDDWQEVRDESAVFWYSPSRDLSVWVDPRTHKGAPTSMSSSDAAETAVATDWVQHDVEDGTGRQYWYSPSLDVSRWTDPFARSDAAPSSVG